MRIELKIVDLLARNADRNFTINEIAKSMKEYYSFVHRTVNKLTKENVITKNKAGRAYLCSLNLDDEKTLTLVQLSEIEKRNEFYDKNKELKLILDDFVKSAESQPSMLSVVLFGSYSKGNTTKESDIDVLLLCKKILDVVKITKEIYAKYGKEINPIIMTLGDFKGQRNKALVKEIVHNHHILYGVENFVGLVFGK